MGDDKHRNLSLRLLGGFLVGLGLALALRFGGIHAESLTVAARLVGELFLRGIFMLILPLIIPMLLLGIQKLTETGAMGRIGIHTVITVLGLTAVAATLGLLLANLVKPGLYISDTARTLLMERFGQSLSATKAITADLLLNLFPKNPLHEMATALTPAQQGGLLSVVSFTILFGIALAKLPAEQTQPVYQFLDVVYQASLWLLLFIMRWVAPVGIAGLIFQAVMGLGWEIFPLLGAYAGTVALGLLLHSAGTYTLFLRFIARVNPLRVLQGSAPALLWRFPQQVVMRLCRLLSVWL